MELEILLADQIKQHPYSINEISLKAGLSRASIHSWISGKAMPSVQNLERLLKVLDCSEDVTEKITSKAQKKRAKNPKNRRRKNAEKEFLVVAELAKQSRKSKVKIEISESPFWELLIHTGDTTEDKQRFVPVLVRLAIDSYEKLFTYASEAKRLNTAPWVAVIVEKVENHRYEDLFRKHKIKILTEDDLSEKFGIQLKRKLRL